MKDSSRAIRFRLLEWFDTNQRDLPWRRTRDPYRVWLAETMLQQTRVAVVVDYYQRFLEEFPTIQKLARARLDPVLRLWAGLGYYQRARNLHLAAKQIVREHNGKFPRRLEAALALPGVGAYTARAVLSIAYQVPVAVVDGNVARALVRLFRLEDADPNDRERLQPLADRLADGQRPGDFNQALMELGSTICLPRRPRCKACPLAQLCAARQAGVEERIGVRRQKRVRPTVTLSVLVARRNGRVLVARETSGFFSGLWHFPYVKGARVNGLARSLGANGLRPLIRFTHQTTMRDLDLRVFEARADSGAAVPGSRWVRLAALARMGIGTATRKMTAALEKEERRNEGCG
jgi:A/G-specific adenine glycosylase